MTAPHAETIVGGYLRRLDDELDALPGHRRREIVSEIREHIVEARGALADESDADLLNLLDRLGDPAEIASEARERFGVTARRGGPLEMAPVLLLGVGNLIVPLVSWLAGALLVWRSPCWTERDKRRGVFIPVVAGLAVLLVTAVVRPGDAVVGGILLVGILVPLGSSVWMSWRLGRRLSRLGWTGVGLVAVAVVLPVAAVLLPTRTNGFIGAPDPEATIAPAGQKACGAFYGTAFLGESLGGRAPLDVGICWNASRVTKMWGPDCYPSYGPLAVVERRECTAVTEPDGSMILRGTFDVRASTSPVFRSTVSMSWRVTPDGAVRQLFP